MKNTGKKVKLTLAVLLALALVIALGACSGGANSAGSNDSYVSNAPYLEDRQESPYMPGQADGGSFGYTGEVFQDTEAAMSPTASPQVAMGSGGTAAEASSNQVAGNDVLSGRKITFWASLSINTKSFDADYQAILDMVNQSGGYVASESMTDSSTSTAIQGRYVYLSIRVPAVGYTSFVDRLSEIGSVTSRNMWSDDLTSVYFDTASRIEMLEIRKERLMNYLLEAERAEDIVSFERELSSVLYELDVYQGNIRQLDQLVDYSTIDVNLVELITPETIGADGEPLGERASSAFALSANGVGRFLQDVVVFLASVVPGLALFLVVLLVAWLLFVAIRKGLVKLEDTPFGKARQKRKEARIQRKMEKKLRQQQLYNQAQGRVYQQAYQAPGHQPQAQNVSSDFPAPSGPPLETAGSDDK